MSPSEEDPAPQDDRPGVTRRKRRPKRLRARPRPLTEDEILAWAQDHHARTGAWPKEKSGPIAAVAGEVWVNVNAALRLGLRGLPGGDSLAKLLARRLGVRNQTSLPTLDIEQILAWVDAHHQRTGAWPTRDSGPVVDAPGETWAALGAALSSGGRGLPGGMTLADLLAQHRGVRNRLRPPPLTEEEILAWADDHFARYGSWPTQYSGAVAAAAGEDWAHINHALRQGRCGLAGGTTLARLLCQRRGLRNPYDLPLSVAEILRWADDYHAQQGGYPTHLSGAIPDSNGETWGKVDGALRSGHRGLPGNSSLAQLLAEQRGVRNHMALPALVVADILAWAEAHFLRTGRWPTVDSGPVVEAPDETWLGIHKALYDGNRGLPGGSSLAQLLAEHRASTASPGRSAD